MTNSLIASRDKFTGKHPEVRVEVNSREWGVIHAESDGPSLLLLPGTLGRGDIFWQQIEALSGQINILALSYPESGTLENWVDDVSFLMDKYVISKATILGSSLGGYVAQYFAAIYRNKVDNLIAANTMSSSQIVSRIPPYILDLDSTPIDSLRQGFISGMKASLVDNPERADLVELLLAEVGGRIPQLELRARLKALKFAPQLPAIELPATNIFTVESGDDPLIPLPMREAVREKLNPARSYHFAAGSHFPYIVQGDDYTNMIKECMQLEAENSNWSSDKTATLKGE